MVLADSPDIMVIVSGSEPPPVEALPAGADIPDPLSPEAQSKVKLLSLGGCINYDICMKAACSDVDHAVHLWRRPTIALMSQPAQQARSFDDSFPAELSRYWQNDFGKTHLRELQNLPKNVLVFDVTRDVLCTLREIEERCFIIDPMSVKNIMWFGDSVDEGRVNAAIGEGLRTINYFDPAYFELWRSHFDEFALFARQYEMVILHRLYFTDRIASGEALTHGDPAVVAAANDFLDQAYDHIASAHGFIRINSVPRRLLVTGPDVSWGGPTYTHLQHEATALFADRLRDILLERPFASDQVLLDCAIDRMNKHEDLARAHRIACAERDALRARLDEAECRLQTLTAEGRGHRGGQEAERAEGHGDHRLAAE